MDQIWIVRVTLTNGLLRDLAGTNGSAIEVREHLRRFEDGNEKWLETTEATVVARAHIVEASPVPLQ